MRYQGVKDGKLVELPVHFSRASGVEDIYAHGAAGSNVANYHFRIDFYRDDFPPTEFIAVGQEVIDAHDVIVERKVVASIIMPLPFLKELRNWLNAKVAEIEKEQGEISLPKTGLLEEPLPKAKEA